LRTQALVSAGQIEDARVDMARALKLDPVDELRQQMEAFQESSLPYAAWLRPLRNEN